MSQAVRIMRKNSLKILVIPSLLLLVVFFIYPIIIVLLKSLTDPEIGLQNYIEFFSRSAYITALVNTFKIAAIVTIITAKSSWCWTESTKGG